ncbi:molybdopterin dehydrogenase [Nocardioides sp. Root122]|uniref:FAD binding domain-containing protein n=1 Tax=Nocardioides TaxID=1839 RepID=UPI0007031709|nr:MULTISPECIES: xanthine dehydrogenase family protein subunit M [Nocardioides]KQV64168.1 molybdopterin dehydrogenase [Nocardioides sp. Root122]MCK9825212.1 xanthine dehydrogenase family protein subunit M [Nocardioides cavernae]
MKPFAYERAATVEDAIALAADGGVYLAGGTNLVDHLRLGVREADRLVDISRLPLAEVREREDGGLVIGAGVRNSDLAAHPLVRTRYPFVTQALVAGASGQLRNMATTGGNLLQRTRCVYFQDLTTPCNKREPGTGCSAVEGLGRHNALIGASDDCVAVHPSDLCVPLAALDAEVVVAGRSGERRIAFADLHRLPGDRPDLDTTLEPGELVLAVELPPLPMATRSRYRKVRERASYAFALVSVAAALDVEDGVVRDVRLALGGVSHKPHRALVAEAALRGEPATEVAYRSAIEAELEAARPGRDNAFKVPLVRNTVVDTLARLAEGSAA